MVTRTDNQRGSLCVCYVLLLWRCTTDGFGHSPRPVEAENEGLPSRAEYHSLLIILFRLRDKNTCPISQWRTFTESLNASRV